MRGILLAGGAGLRLYPLTAAAGKQLLPVYDKPMIYYPLSTLMLAGIREVLVISTPEDTPRLRTLLGEGDRYGLRLRYAVQPAPEGLAQAFLIGEDFLGGQPCAMPLGDNLLCGSGLSEKLREAGNNAESGRAAVFGYRVEDPERFGVLEVDGQRVLSIEEKPRRPRSHYAVVGLFFYPAGVSKLARTLRPSARGELEITDLNALYLQQGRLEARLLGRGYAWMDAGTVESLLEAAEYVRVMQKRQRTVIAAPEEIAFRLGWITGEELLAAARRCGSNAYGDHLRAVAEEGGKE